MSGALHYYERLLPEARVLEPEEFRAALYKLGLTQKALAALVGVNDRTVRQWATKTRTPAPVALLLHVLQRHYTPILDANMGNSVSDIVSHARNRAGDAGDVLARHLLGRMLDTTAVQNEAPPAPFKARSARVPEMVPVADVEIGRPIPIFSDFRGEPGRPLHPGIKSHQQIKADNLARDPGSALADKGPTQRPIPKLSDFRRPPGVRTLHPAMRSHEEIKAAEEARIGLKR